MIHYRFIENETISSGGIKPSSAVLSLSQEKGAVKNMALTKELLDNMYNILAEALDGDKEAFRDLLRLWKLEPFIREELSNQLAECLSRLYISNVSPK